MDLSIYIIKWCIFSCRYVIKTIDIKHHDLILEICKRHDITVDKILLSNETEICLKGPSH